MKLKNYFTRFELFLWLGSLALIIGSAIIFPGQHPLTVIAAVIGVTAIITGAKGNPLSKVLMIIFSLFYGYISWTFDYYGEMITYLGMTGPMEAFALYTWLKNPFEEGKVEVRVNQLSKRELIFILLLSAVVALIFYPILAFFNTENLIPSTISVLTSFLAVFLTYRRSEYFPLAYASNDLVLICLWALASLSNRAYLSVVICFLVFFVNDMYSYLSWARMRQRQRYRQEN
ncbi:nicotinamide riboside transporter PnuC [Aerococcus kribbianus]|uniref:Nicotinamide riboside transporter PnuC n=1 Tax=Aerococcus kribbianus TaxID=2999064 RepID=A0A9X3FLS5_9LACT|nr:MULTISPECIES: nicotinamide riboside transporter PnuC [unclassified Aerococcus]MCZ0716862.1 nicotinamide riboside transporter PnuC [Aerococcus sp. YH-aer221]MCZ0725150.1 nicotinamide riboside transporter PnuC [Aerococcus sp. YH-aer222]